MFDIKALAKAIEERSGSRLTSELVGGAETASVSGFAPLEAARADQVSFVAQSKYRDAAAASCAGVLVVTAADRQALYGDDAPRAMVLCKNPYAWFAYALQIMLGSADGRQAGIDPRAIVEDGASIDPSAIVESGAVIKAGAVIGARSRICSGAVIGERVTMGEDCLIHSNVTVYHDCRLGSRVILHSGCVIGADGFGFAPLDGIWVKIPQIGIVELGDDVEVGANTTIDRGALANTVVGRGTKLDNLIQLGHNVRVGEDSLMCSCVGVAGSTHIGSHCVIGGAANINGHITIPDMAQVGPATSITSWDEREPVMMGFFPAQGRRAFEKSAAIVMRLPDMRRQLKALEAQVEELKKQIAKDA